uniref:Queuine tRNA-ribosyltransferase n=1 Tax=uncultured marine virus TaxID=186617 RepID=A0A0F7L3E4_9VIRU|nr:queuine tRNA-ribosyltransferase [uncultured marine virus]
MTPIPAGAARTPRSGPDALRWTCQSWQACPVHTSSPAGPPNPACPECLPTSSTPERTVRASSPIARGCQSR